MSRVIAVFFSAILGACFGSFANVIAVRLHEMSSIGGRSRCPECRKTIRPRHLVPIVSWLVLKGHCANCGAKIHIQYPLVELTSAALFVIAALRHDPFVSAQLVPFVFEVVVSLALLIMVAMDLRWKELPLEIMIGISVMGCLFQLGDAFFGDAAILLPTVWHLVLAAAVPIVFFGAQWILSNGKWLGSGDIWFGVMMAMVLGSWSLVGLAIYGAYLIGGIVVMVLLVLKKASRGMRLPFAPALAAGLLLGLWFGPTIISRLHYVWQ